MTCHRLTTLATLAALVLAGCGDSKPAADTTADGDGHRRGHGHADADHREGDRGPHPDAGGHALGQGRAGDLGAPGDPPTKLVVRDLEVGKGAAAERGKALAVEYKGIRWADGSSSTPRGTAASRSSSSSAPTRSSRAGRRASTACASVAAAS